MVFIKTISRVYLILALLAATLLSPLPYSITALILLSLQIYSIYKPLSADLNLTLTFFTLFLMPLTLQPSAEWLFSALLVIPAIPLLDQALKDNALNQHFHPSEGRKPTTILRTLSITLIVVLIASLILANWTLSLTSALLAAYLIAVSAYILYSIPTAPLQGSGARVRVIAGDTCEASAAIKSRAKLPLHTLFKSSYPWGSIDPARLKLGRHEAKLSLSLTPPLSGPSKPQLQALMADPWGLIQMSQNLEPVEVFVIPRARYAEWLAKKFLGQAILQFAPTVTTAPSSTAPIAARRGEEYLTSRTYQPGDRLKDMDWKHMCKLNEIVVKDYSQAQEIATIIATNLTVKDPEEADNLAYSLITLALTLARVTTPAALAAYNHQEVLLTTEAVEPREILKSVLKLAQNITLVEPVQRFLQPPDIRRLKSTATRLEQVKTEPAQRLAELLRLENDAIQQGAKDHPAARAITKTAENVQPPATIAVVSRWNHDTEALLATLDRLEKQGYNIMSIEAARKS